MNNNQKKLLNQLETLAQKAASQQAEIAGQEAEHAFRTLLQHKIEIEMKRQAEKTYNKLLTETQELVNQFAKKASQRVLDIESSTSTKSKVTSQKSKVGNTRFLAFIKYPQVFSCIVLKHYYIVY